jgi:hypothetical protein
MKSRAIRTAGLGDTMIYEGLFDPVVRAYDLTKFCGDVVLDIMRTHPSGHCRQHHPYLVPPDQFLRELRERRRPGSSGRLGLRQ